MKTFVMALTVLVGSACAKATSTAPVGLGEEFPLRVGETVTVGRTGLRITFQAVLEDSRCPPDVTCVWAGNGRVGVRVTRDPSVTTDLELNTTLAPKAVPVDAYELRLIALAPASHPQIADNYVATLQVVER